MATYDSTKLEPKTHGPYEIAQVFTNGTVKIQRDETEEEIAKFPHKEPNVHLAQERLTIILDPTDDGSSIVRESAAGRPF